MQFIPNVYICSNICLLNLFRACRSNTSYQRLPVEEPSNSTAGATNQNDTPATRDRGGVFRPASVVVESNPNALPNQLIWNSDNVGVELRSIAPPRSYANPVAVAVAMDGNRDHLHRIVDAHPTTAVAIEVTADVSDNRSMSSERFPSRILLSEQIRDLHKCYQEGILTWEEYMEAKKGLLMNQAV